MLPTARAHRHFKLVVGPEALLDCSASVPEMGICTRLRDTSSCSSPIFTALPACTSPSPRVLRWRSYTHRMQPLLLHSTVLHQNLHPRSKRYAHKRKQRR